MFVSPSMLEAMDRARSALEGLPLVDSYGAPVAYVGFDYQGDGWLDLGGDCLTTRYEVLAAESLEPVVWSGGCFVESGLWVDAWFGEEITDASQAMIDPVVSLFHAHHAGAWEWDSDTKQRFANNTHPRALNVVSRSTNSAKDADGPADWRPPDRGYWCSLPMTRTVTKARWGLAVTETERDALFEMLDTCTEADTEGIRDETPINPGELDAVPVIGIAAPSRAANTNNRIGRVTVRWWLISGHRRLHSRRPDLNCGDIPYMAALEALMQPTGARLWLRAGGEVSSSGVAARGDL